jgi:hypothetical protein
MSKTAAACLAGFVNIVTAPMGRWLASATRARTAQHLTPQGFIESTVEPCPNARRFNRIFARP